MDQPLYKVIAKAYFLFYSDDFALDETSKCSASVVSSFLFGGKNEVEVNVRCTSLTIKHFWLRLFVKQNYCLFKTSTLQF